MISLVHFLSISILFAVILLSSQSVTATENEFQQWSTLNLNYAIDELHSFNLLTQGRFSTDGSRSDVYVIRPSMHRRLNEMIVTGIGYDYLHVDPGNDEQRFWQEMSWNHPGSRKLKFSHRLRLEERFIENIDVIFRSRYRLKGVYPLSDKRWFLAGYNEIFFNMNSRDEGPSGGLDQNRLFAGWGYRFTEKANMEFGYQWRFLNRRSIDNINDHTFVINVYFNGP